MRLPRLLLSAILTLAFAQAQEDGADGEDAFELRQLTDDTFKSSVAEGLWLVEHFSPKCSHCRAFAPTWERLARDKQHLERLAGFHMAQVNCMAQGDLCNANGIKYYPQLIPYTDGEALEPYTGDRSYDELARWIDEQAIAYARGAKLGSAGASGDEEDDGGGGGGGDGSVAGASEGLVRPNPDGVVVEVDHRALDGYIKAGPVFVDYFAPWCGHCKKLRPSALYTAPLNYGDDTPSARADVPVYEKLAEAMRGKLNVVAVDCDANAALCRASGVRAYPTIRLYHHDTQTEYTGARTVEAMQAYVSKSIDPVSLQPIKVEDFGSVVLNEDAFFLYLQTFDTTVDELQAVRSALEPLIGSVPTYTSSDPLLYANLSIANPPPSSLLLAFSSHSPKPVATLPLPADAILLARFVALHRVPTLVELTSANYAAIMQSDTRALVVLGAFHRGAAGADERARFETIARAWKRGGRQFVQPVWFAWVEGEKWTGWLRQSYGIRKSNLPAVVVVNPPESEYYDMTIEGTHVVLDGASVFSVLEGVYQHFLRPKKIETALEWGSRSAAMKLIGTVEWAVEHPVTALAALLGSVATFIYLLQRCVQRDLAHHSANHGNEKGTSRMD